MVDPRLDLVLDATRVVAMGSNFQAAGAEGQTAVAWFLPGWGAPSSRALFVAGVSNAFRLAGFPDCG